MYDGTDDGRRSMVYYKFTLVAWRLSWAKNARVSVANNKMYKMLFNAFLGT